jgi:hypothetical protein
MEGTDDLREQARQWRRIAQRYTPGLARALIEAAKTLDEQADRIEGVRRAPPAVPGAADRPKSS